MAVKKKTLIDWILISWTNLLLYNLTGMCFRPTKVGCYLLIDPFWNRNVPFHFAYHELVYTNQSCHSGGKKWINDSSIAKCKRFIRDPKISKEIFSLRLVALWPLLTIKKYLLEIRVLFGSNFRSKTVVWFTDSSSSMAFTKQICWSPHRLWDLSRRKVLTLTASEKYIILDTSFFKLTFE